MRHHRIQIILAAILATSVVRSEYKLTRMVEHKINKREDVVNKHQRDPGKVFNHAGKLYPIPEAMANTTRLVDVKTIEGRARPMRNHSNRNMHGFLQLIPQNQFMQRSYNPRSQKLTPRNRYKYNNSRPRMHRSKQHDESLAGSFSRWFLSDSEEVAESRPMIVSRHSSHRPSTYHKYPPYWPSSPPTQHKFNSFPRFQKSRAVNHHRPFVNNKINFVKTECNACNSVPWTPILKPSAVHHNSFGGDSQSYGVPTIEVHHDSSGYDSSHRQNVVPAPVVEHPRDTTIPESYGLPIGNIPTAHGLLPPINHVKINPTGLVPPPPTLLQPIPTDGLLQSIQYPELSPIPVAPIHNSNQFLEVETPDLVPPIPPQKSVSNVVFTISENDAGHNEPLIDNHISQSGAIHGADQHSESSSFVNTHLISHGPFNPYNPTNNHVNLDIVKSVPVAEYTSSIQYPLQIIQSPQYIDIAPPPPNDTKTDPPTYEKQPQTGSQKISDILFGLVKDGTSNKPVIDAPPSGSRLLEQSSQHVQTQSNHYIPSNGPVVSDSSKNNYVESTQLYTQNQYSSDLVFEQPQGPIWTGGSQPPFVVPNVHPPHQAKLESGGDGLLPDPTSTTWLIPAQSNLAPQWILPVSNPPSIPYPLLQEEEGIASAVNGELSPTSSPQPVNDSKKKKIQIIIPYTTGNNNKEFDQNIVESEIYKTFSEGNISQENDNSGHQIAEFSVPNNSSEDSKFLSDVHHILAFNIKELLNEEVEQPKAEQNIRLQKNIDNWTALEYSNHKTVAKKEPQDVISYANAVTSIPGTSISHLLLTSKKIPDKYLTTTPVPTFDEPTTTPFAQSSGVSVESKPFTTKTYDTSGLYSTVTRIAPTTTTLRTIVTDILKEKPNHRNGYTEVAKTKANQWGKLNENLVLPENLSNRTTPGWSNKKLTGHDENVYVVTPVSVWQSNGDVGKRTTRQVFMTEKPEIKNVTVSQEATKSYIAKLFGNKTERAKISKFNKPKLIQKFFPTTKATPRNITKIEIPKTKVEIDNVVEDDNETDTKSFNDVFPFRNGGELPLELAIVNSTTEATTIPITNRNNLVKQVKEKNFKESKIVKKQNEVDVPAPTSTEAPESTTTELFEGDNSTEIIADADDEEFGLRIVKEDKTNGTNRSRNSLSDSSIKNKTDEDKSSILPAGIFGETKRVHVKGREKGSTSELKSLSETIRLLKEYLADDSDDLPEEKTDGSRKVKKDRP